MKNRTAFFLVGRHVLGKGSLNGTGTQGKADAEYRMDHVVDAKPLCTDSPGHKNTVEKAKNTAEEAGSGKKERTGQKGTFFRGEGDEGLLHEASKKGKITINL